MSQLFDLPDRVLENDLAVALDVLMELDAGRRLRDQLFELRFARQQQLRPDVVAVEFQQIEGIEQHPIIVLAAVQIIEIERPLSSQQTASLSMVTEPARIATTASTTRGGIGSEESFRRSTLNLQLEQIARGGRVQQLTADLR